MTLALPAVHTEREGPIIKLCTAAELHRLRYDQLSPTQARRIHDLMHHLGSYAENMDFPEDIARIFATMHHVLVAMASHTQTDHVAVLDGDVLVQSLPPIALKEQSHATVTELPEP